MYWSLSEFAFGVPSCATRPTAKTRSFHWSRSWEFDRSDTDFGSGYQATPSESDVYCFLIRASVLSELADSPCYSLYKISSIKLYLYLNQENQKHRSRRPTFHDMSLKTYLKV